MDLQTNNFLSNFNENASNLIDALLFNYRNNESELINKYVFFTNEESDDEVIVLVSLAQYLDSLNNKTILNQNIPNKNHFRERILEGKELTELYRKETKSDSQNDIDIKTLLAKYGG